MWILLMPAHWQVVEEAGSLTYQLPSSAMEMQYEQLSTAAESEPASTPKLQQKGGVDAAAVASALPYKDSNGQPVFCQMLSDAEASGQQKCLVCSANVKAGSMHEHEGSHILQQHVSSDACGFCGGTSCIPYLTANGQPGKPEGCPAFVKFNTKPCVQDRAQCNNHLMECPAGCKAVVWKYGLAAHFTAKHPERQLEQKQPFIIERMEQKHMEKVAKGVHAPRSC